MLKFWTTLTAVCLLAAAAACGGEPAGVSAGELLRAAEQEAARQFAEYAAAHAAHVTARAQNPDWVKAEQRYKDAVATLAATPRAPELPYLKAESARGRAVIQLQDVGAALARGDATLERARKRMFAAQLELQRVRAEHRPPAPTGAATRAAATSPTTRESG